METQNEEIESQTDTSGGGAVAAAVATPLLTPVRGLFAQNAGSNALLSTAINAKLRVLSTYQAALESALSKLSSDQVASYHDIAAFLTAYTNWTSQLTNFGYFSALDSVVKSQPSVLLTTPVTLANLTSIVQYGESLGFSLPSAANIQQAITTTQSSGSTGTIVNTFQQGTSSIFTGLGSDFVGTFQLAGSSPRGGGAGGSCPSPEGVFGRWDDQSCSILNFVTALAALSEVWPAIIMTLLVQLAYC